MALAPDHAEFVVYSENWRRLYTSKVARAKRRWPQGVFRVAPAEQVYAEKGNHFRSCGGTIACGSPLPRMTIYFFDLRSHGQVLTDEEGLDQANIDAAFDVAMVVLGNLMRDIVRLDTADQSVAVEVRDEVGSLFVVNAVVGSKLLRKQ